MKQAKTRAKPSKKHPGKIKSEIITFWRETKKPFLIITAILFVSFFAILRSNFLYIDDMGRTMDGYTGWGGFSRYTSLILSVLIHTGINLADASPLSQLLAILFLALACCLLLYIFKVKLFRQKINFFDIFAACLLALCPYFLECISYKFDSPFMALSILVAVLPFFFFFISRRAFYISIFFCTILMCTTYQASSGIFPILALFVSFVRLYQKENPKIVFKELGLIALIYVASLAFFSLVLMRPIPTDSYVSNQLQSFPEIIPGFFSRLGSYYQIVFSDFRVLWLILIGLVALLFPVLVAMRSRQIRTTIFAVLTVGFSALFAFGLFPALQISPTFPRAMYGVGIIFALCALQVSCLAPSFAWRLPVAALFYCFVVFAFIYGNALNEQREWANFRMTVLADDTKSLPAFEDYENKSLKFGGSIQHAGPIRNYVEHSGANVLSRLVPVVLQGDEIWSIFYVAYFGFGPLEYRVGFDESELADYEKAIDNYYHTIYTKDSDVIVIFK